MDTCRRPKVHKVITKGDLDDNATISLRCKGYVFDIMLSPSNFKNSPKTTTMYLKYLKPLHPMDPSEFEDAFEEDEFWKPDLACSPESYMRPAELTIRTANLF